MFGSSSSSMCAFNMQARLQRRLNADARLGPIMLKIAADESDQKTCVAIAHFRTI